LVFRDVCMRLARTVPRVAGAWVFCWLWLYLFDRPGLFARFCVRDAGRGSASVTGRSCVREL